jgi:hypothetical protein
MSGGPTLKLYLDHRHVGVTRCEVPSDPALGDGLHHSGDNGVTRSATKSATQNAKEGPRRRMVDNEIDDEPAPEHPGIIVEQEDLDPMCDTLCLFSLF